MEKERNYLFDTFRGLLIWSIPISHFTRVGGHFAQDSLSGIVYITINVFVMQAFMFLSGYFSKKPARARETAFKTFMLPYLVWTLVFFIFRYCYFGNARLNFLQPPFALWFLFSTFFYRYFLMDLIRIKHLLIVATVLFLVAGQIPWFTDFLALGRTVSYFPFFLLGYYCSKERLESLQHLKKYQSVFLFAALVGVSCVLAFFVKVPVGFYLLKTTAEEIGIAWYADILMRSMIYILALGWMLLMFNILPVKKNYVSYIGMNTMPVYILHLFIRYIVESNGFPYPNQVVYYACVYGFASLCVLGFSSPPVAKLYDRLMDSLYDVWIKLKGSVLYDNKQS